MTDQTSSAPIVQLSEKQQERFAAFASTRHLADILRGEVFAEQILALPLNPELHRVDDEATVGEYLAAILNQLLHEGSDFDPKRSLGVTWDYPIDDALNTANLTPLALRAAVRDLFAGGPARRLAAKAAAASEKATAESVLNSFENQFAARVTEVLAVFERFRGFEGLPTYSPAGLVDDLETQVLYALGLVPVDADEETEEEAAA